MAPTRGKRDRISSTRSSRRRSTALLRRSLGSARPADAAATSRRRSSSRRSPSPPIAPSARGAPAPSTRSSSSGDRIHADNFDGVGLVADIERNLGCPLAGKRVLLMGAGGAVRGALLPFLERKPALVVVANRTVTKAMTLGTEFAGLGALETGGYADLGDRAFDIVVNGTSASMRGELPPVTRTAFAPGCLAYDLVYGKGLSPVPEARSRRRRGTVGRRRRHAGRAGGRSVPVVAWRPADDETRDRATGGATRLTRGGTFAKARTICAQSPSATTGISRRRGG